MKQVTIQTRTDGPVQVGARYVAPGGVFAVTPSYKEPNLGSKWTVTHIPTGRQCIARRMRLENLNAAKDYARYLAELFGPIQSPCDITNKQVKQLNSYLGIREFRTWEPDDPDYPCGAPTVPPAQTQDHLTPT